jgi:hypothetical protein
MGRKREMPRYVPKSRGNCPRCGQPVYKGYTRYKGHYWHSVCLVNAARNGEV